MTFYEFMTLLSLSLTPGTIISAFLVASIFWHPFVKSLNDKERTNVGWMIIGVEINFVGGMFDNLWWGIAWSGDFVNSGSELREYFFTYGVYSNVFFRQACGLIGAFCHLNSGFSSNKSFIKKTAYISAFLGIGWVLALFYLRSKYGVIL